MASISTGGGHGGKKAVDSDIPLVPFIDLLLCCVMFLLVTAVWNQLASVDANLDAPGRDVDSCIDCVEDQVPLVVRVTQEGFVLSSEAGDELRVPLASDGEYDTAALEQQLDTRHDLDPSQEVAILTADDGVQYAALVSTMDSLAGHGFPHVTMTGDR